MDVKIYKPSKNAMQSGRAGTSDWVLEYVSDSEKKPEPLMGWTAAADTLGQVRLRFSTREAAVSFAEEKGWDYVAAAENARRVKPKNYADNFKYLPPVSQKKT